MIPFINLQPLRESLAGEIAAAVSRVVNSGWYILGPEVEAFERSFAAYHGVAAAVGVANGTDAVELALRAGGIGPGDEVITVAHTAVATVCAVERTGAKVVLVDIDPVSFTLDPAAIRAAISPRTKAIVPVHLYGHPAEMNEIMAIAGQHHLLVVEDCAQAHGARYNGRLVGTIGHLGAFSFYPTKNLGALGDGGAIVTNDSQLAARLKRLRFYGQSQRYLAAERGMNSRLDELQAAILSVKLPHLDEHNAARRSLAAYYSKNLHSVGIPKVDSRRAQIDHVYHLYVIRHPQRDQIRAALQQAGIESQMHYPVPIHLQPAYADLGYRAGSLPNTERAANEVLSLPMYVGLTLPQAARIAAAVSITAHGGAHGRIAA